MEITSHSQVRNCKGVASLDQALSVINAAQWLTPQYSTSSPKCLVHTLTPLIPHCQICLRVSGYKQNIVKIVDGIQSLGTFTLELNIS